MKGIWLAFAARLAITALILGLLFRIVDVAALLGAMSRLSPAPVALALGLQILVVIVSAWRWQTVLRHLGHSVPLPFLARISLIGAYLGLLVPSGIGADVVRGYHLGKENIDRPTIIVSILYDRISGLIVLGLMSVPGVVLILGTAFSPIRPGRSVIVVSLAVAFAALAAAFLLRNALRRLARKLLGARGGQEGKLATLIRDRPLIARTALLSVAAHLLTIGMVALLGIALGATIPLLAYVIYFPVVSMVSLMPVSLNGLGVRDAAFVVLFGTAGMPPETALALSLLFFVAIILTAGVGAVLYLVSRAGSPTAKTKSKPAISLRDRR